MNAIRLIPILVFLLSLSGFELNAHPGGVDKEGCHPCRKKCDQWDVSATEKHCHKGQYMFRRYIFRDKFRCESPKFTCQRGEGKFKDEKGCGCMVEDREQYKRGKQKKL